MRQLAIALQYAATSEHIARFGIEGDEVTQYDVRAYAYWLGSLSLV